MNAMFRALGQRNYRYYVTGSMVSNVGTWMQRVAQDWLVLELSGGSGVAVGLTTALQFLPSLVFPGISGLAADRFDKRTLLRITQAWMAICSLVLGVLAITGAAVTWHVYLLALLFGVGSAFDVPARQAFVSEVVGPDLLSNAIALNSACFNSARLIGPAVAGIVINRLGSGWAILTNGVSYLAFILALSIMDAAQLRIVPPAKRAKRQIRQAMGYIMRRPDIMLVLIILAFFGTFGLNFQLTSVLMTTQVFHLGAEEYGVLGTIMAVGSIAGALVGARRVAAPRLRFMIGTTVAFALLLMVSGMMPTYVSYAITLPLVGLSSMLAMNAANTIVQISIDPQLRGRVMAVYFLVFMGGTPLGSPLLGWVAQVAGARWTLIGGGGLVLVGVALALILMMPRLGLTFRGAIHTTPLAPTPATPR